MPGWRVDTQRLDGISVEHLDLEMFPLALAQPDWSRRRKAAPLNTLLPFTWLWAKGLPPQVRPVALMDAFPRIANLLAANWKDSTAFYRYMGNLLIDRRGSRQGFSAEIKEELLRLRTAYQLRKAQRTLAVTQEASPATPPASPDAACVETQSI